MKILITGAYGFFGQNLSKYLYTNLQTSSYIYNLNGKKGVDLKNEEQVEITLKDFNPDIIIHLAANPRGNAGLEAMLDNVQGTHNLVHHAPQNCHFIFASSIVVYGDYHCYNFLEDMQPKPTSLYALSKYNAENIVNRYERIGKIKKTNLRLCALVGPNLTHGFIFDLINKIKSDSPELELIGAAPGSIKPFLNVEDACNTVLHAIQKKMYGTYNVCPRDNISVEQVAKMAMKTLNIYKPIKWRPDLVWGGDNNEIRASNNKLFSHGFDFKYKNSPQAIQAYLDELKLD